MIKADCDEELQKALPLYEEATKALKSLKPADFVLLNAMQHPPSGVVLALEGACIMLEEKPIIVNKNGVKSKDYWKKSLSIMKNHKKFIERLEKYDKNNLDQKLKKIIETEYMTMEEFTPARIRNASEAAEGIAKWVIALVKYDTVYLTIVPKRKAAEAA
jgi:dynein heavy chain